MNIKTTHDVAHGLTIGTLLLYGMPMIGLGCMLILVNTYLMKFSTDVLMITPVVMGVVFGLSRMVEAISSPLFGYLGDKTISRLGRRRSWMLASIIPLSIFSIAVWSPPRSLYGVSLTAWMTICIFGIFIGITMFVVPELSLGAELSTNYRERNRLYGSYNIFMNLGQFIGLGGMYLMITSQDPRNTAINVMATITIATVIMIAVMVMYIRERPDYQGRAATTPLQAFADVWKNRHARLVILVCFIDSLGVAVMSILTVYFAEYILGTPEKTPYYIAVFMCMATISTPLWVKLADYFEKKTIRIVSFLIMGFGFGSTYLIGPHNSDVMYILAAILGTGAGCAMTIGFSILADIVDYDEYVTGQRKEGSYFSIYFFIFKTGLGITLFLTGFILELAGFQPNTMQSGVTRLAMRSMYAFFPLFFYMLAIAIFLKYNLNRVEHKRIRQVIDSRSGVA